MAATKGGSRRGSSTAKPATKTTIKTSGKKPITFKPGALHAQLGVPQGQAIPPAKMAAAQRGDYGPLAKQRADFAQAALKTGQKTAASNRRKASRGKSSG